MGRCLARRTNLAQHGPGSTAPLRRSTIRANAGGKRGRRRGGSMGLMDKVKAQAEAGMAKASEAGKAGQAKLDAVQAKRNPDDLLRQLGAAAYADHEGRSTDQTTADAARIVGELEKYEAEHGPLVP